MLHELFGSLLLSMKNIFLSACDSADLLAIEANFVRSGQLEGDMGKVKVVLGNQVELGTEFLLQDPFDLRKRFNASIVLLLQIAYSEQQPGKLKPSVYTGSCVVELAVEADSSLAVLFSIVERPEGDSEFRLHLGVVEVISDVN